MTGGQRQKLTSERSEGGFGNLNILEETCERDESSSEGADDEQELTKAATVIQEKFRQRMVRRSIVSLDSVKTIRKDIGDQNGSTSPTSATSDDSGTHDTGISPVAVPDIVCN